MLESPGETPEVTIDDLEHWMAEGWILVDVRTKEEYVEGHVPGARLVPLDSLDSLAEELAEKTRVLCICRSGQRSARAVSVLRQRGIDARNVAGGTLAWIEAGRRVVRGSQPE